MNTVTCKAKIVELLASMSHATSYEAIEAIEEEVMDLENQDIQAPANPEIETVEYRVAWPFIAAVINGDPTGLEEEEYLQLQQFLMEEQAMNGQGHWTVGDEEAEFCWCEITGKMADCHVLTFVCMGGAS